MGATTSIINSRNNAADPKIDNTPVGKGCNLFLKDPQARNIYIQYIKKGEWRWKLPIKSSENNSKNLLMTIMYSNFIISASPSELASELLSASNEPQHFDKNLDLLQCETPENFQKLLLASIFPIFLNSAEYCQWIETRSTMGNEWKSLNSQGIIDDIAREDRLDKLFSQNLSSVASNAAISVDDEELASLLSLGHLLGDLLAAVDSLRLCVTLSTASKDRPNFPLIYVNKAFEELTGYTRNEAIGRNCKFLQSDSTEKDQIELMTKSLSTAQSVKVAVTNRRKDGTDFLNLLSMKPVFDSKGVYSYVIGVQCNFSSTGSHIEDITLIDDLLSVFPNVLK